MNLIEGVREEETRLLVVAIFPGENLVLGSDFGNFRDTSDILIPS